MWEQDKAYLTYEANKLTEGVKLRTTDHWIFRIAAWLLFLVTLGKKKVEDIAQHTAMAIGGSIYFPKGWTSLQVLEFLPHECKHVRHAQVLGCGRASIGMVPYWFLYFLVPLPVGLALFRAWAEADCWEQQLKQGIFYSKEQAITYGANKLSSWSYLFALPRFLAVPFLKWKYRKI